MPAGARTSRFRTTEVAAVHQDRCDHVFDRVEPVDPRRGIDFSCEVTQLGDLMLADVHHGEAVRIASRYPGHHTVAVPQTGSVRGRVGDHWVAMDRRRGAVMNPDDGRDLVWSPRTSATVVWIPEDRINTMASPWRAGRTAPTVEFQRSLDLDAPGVRTWRRMVSLLREELRTGTPMLDSDLARVQVEQTLIAGLLAAAPNSSHLSPDRDEVVSASHTVRRALDVIEDRPDHPWRVDTLAAEVGVSARTLQDTFRREQGTTPLRELRRVRLERAHAELLEGDPASTSVTEIALRWGFPHLGRFSQAYRTTHGRLPSVTLGTVSGPGRY